MPKMPRAWALYNARDNTIKAEGFYLGGKGGNNLNNLICKNVVGNQINSSGNFLNGLEISGKFTHSGLNVYSGSNVVENINIWGQNAALHVDYNSVRSRINNCQSEKICIKGESHKVENSKAEQILVSGNGHKFANCEAELLKLAEGTEIESNGCDYKLTELFHTWDFI